MKAKALIAGAVIAPVVLFTGTTYAALGGQVEGGDIYRVRNVSKNGEFTDPATANKCEVVQFKVRIHNPGPNPLESVNVKATLPSTAGTSHSSKVTITAANSDPEVTTDTAGVNLSESLKLSYVPGSTELLDANNAKLSTLPDTIFTSGVNIDTVGVSTQQKRFVQFQAKVDCPQPVTPEQPKPKAPAAPQELPKTGAGDVVATVAGATILGAIAHRLFSRRLARR